mgnify:CR=1 FL=1|jgi:hypothetical protein
MKNLLKILLFVLLISHTTYANSAKQVTDLPDVSVIGNFVGTITDDSKQFDVSEIEFAFQHYLYPDVRADIFTALHKESSGETAYELEEAYVTFFNVPGVFFPNYAKDLVFSGIVGKKLLNIGKINSIHSDQWDFVDKSIVLKQFFGEDHGLSGEGGLVSYLLPTPFFSQLELGAFTVQAHDESAGDSHGVEYENRLFNTRLWNSFKVSETNELQVGLNYVLGNVTASSSDDQQSVIGTDITYYTELNNSKSLTLLAEFYSAKYGEEGETRETQTGGFVRGIYSLNQKYNAGIRYGFLGKHGDEGNTSSQLAFMLTRQLTETSKFRVQYNTGDNVTDTIYVQFLFGMGPHSHVLN